MPVPNATGSHNAHLSRSLSNAWRTSFGTFRAPSAKAAIPAANAGGVQTREGAIAIGAGLLEAAPTLAGQRPAAPGIDYGREFDACPAFCTVPYRISAHRRCEDRAFQLALCAPHRRPLSAPYRRHRSRAVHA